MFKLGLTGSIATGKSTVLGLFEARGVPVFSADAAVHRLYAGSGAAAVEALFPGIVVDGRVDRGRLAERLLGAQGRLAELEAVIHPLVRAEVGAFFAAAEAAGAQLAVIDIPLLYETGFDYGLDGVAVTLCSVATQRTRAMARPGMTVEKLDAIVARQLPQAEKRQRATYAFDTDMPLADTERMVEALIAAIAARASTA
ncbi:MAG: dephospho-CoA kinase [Devosia sp.]|nr:dephospho-CoA kinase [Devosia sp.]